MPPSDLSSQADRFWCKKTLELFVTRLHSEEWDAALGSFH